ncbi:MAG: DUF4062 domain-containing protein [Bacteroidales bacterium]|nr:DUF4062 domain-containing protein [Bacteroidales bacterium]
MHKKKIFISSVQSEFQNERKHLAEYIRQDALFSQYFEPFLFEELPAQDKSAQIAYLEQAAHADVYLLLIGKQYGFEDTKGISPTECEYNTATFHQVYRLAFVKLVAQRDVKEELFKQKIDSEVIRNSFSSYEELQSSVYASLVDYMLKNNLLHRVPFDSSVFAEATINDLDNAKIRWFVGLAREKRQFPLQYSEDNIHQILSSLHLITDDDKIKNAALLLFAKDVQKWFTSATIKCAQFYGTKVQKPMLSQQIYGGNIFEMVDQAVGFVMSRINQHVGERIHSAQVDVTPELPTQAVMEAIVNAVVHRDYNSTGSVQVMLFKDRLEVWNPGRLPQGMTIKKLTAEHSSRPVNPVLANPVYLAGYIEQMGTGTTDIIDSCEAMNLKTPEFYQDEDFRTILWRAEYIDVESDINTNVSQKDRQKLGKRQQKILRLIGDNIYISAEDIAKKLNVTPRTIYRDLKSLHIKWSGAAKTGHWVFEKQL